jgi:hypothetical protein
MAVSFPDEEYEPGNMAFSLLSHVGDNSTVEAMNVRDLFSYKVGVLHLT